MNSALQVTKNELNYYKWKDRCRQEGVTKAQHDTMSCDMTLTVTTILVRVISQVWINSLAGYVVNYVSTGGISQLQLTM